MKRGTLILLAAFLIGIIIVGGYAGRPFIPKAETPVEETKKMTTAEPPTVKTGQEPKGSLGAYYLQTPELDITDFKVTYVRLTIPWGVIEPEKGKFAWDTEPIRRIDRSLEKGVKVVPVIRTVGASWALRNAVEGCSAPPKDLEDEFNGEYGYSKLYYDFVSEIAKRYKGKLEIVVIENEVIAEKFWCGSMDEYLRLLATARKAFRDVDPNVKVADSGLPSLIWGVLISRELLDKGKEEEAVNFFNAYFSQSFITAKVSSAQELKAVFNKKNVKEKMEKAEYLLERLNGSVDIVNFHFYEPPELFHEVVSFIREKTGGMPMMTNELGARYRLDEPGRQQRAAKDLVKKFALSQALGLKAAIWFSFTNDEHNIVGLVDEKRRGIKVTMEAFAASMNFLNSRLLSYRNLSSGGVEWHSFTFQNRKVDVLWSNDAGKVVTVPEGCEAYDFRGSRIAGTEINLTSSPVFIVCER
ncbi:MAG: hypothetical protein ACXQTF_01595 [Candidatus Hecatellaceae archaeon]